MFTKNLIGSSCYKETIEKTIRECEEKGLLTEFIAENRGKLMDLLEDRFFNPDKLHAQETYNVWTKGKEEGRIEKTIGIAGKMIEDDVPLETISELTDLSEEDVLGMQNDLTGNGLVHTNGSGTICDSATGSPHKYHGSQCPAYDTVRICRPFSPVSHIGI